MHDENLGLGNKDGRVVSMMGGDYDATREKPFRFLLLFRIQLPVKEPWKQKRTHLLSPRNRVTYCHILQAVVTHEGNGRELYPSNDEWA
jgi:hypothetical protein